MHEIKNEKSTWVFLYIKYSILWSTLLENFVERKPLIYEECFYFLHHFFRFRLVTVPKPSQNLVVKKYLGTFLHYRWQKLSKMFRNLKPLYSFCAITSNQFCARDSRLARVSIRKTNPSNYTFLLSRWSGCVWMAGHPQTNIDSSQGLRAADARIVVVYRSNMVVYRALHVQSMAI